MPKQKINGFAVLDKDPEIPRRKSKSKWSLLKDALWTAPEGRWLVVPVAADQDIHKVQINVLGSLRSGRTRLALECRQDHLNNCIYVRRRPEEMVG